jgi:hypothetical protein
VGQEALKVPQQPGGDKKRSKSPLTRGEKEYSKSPLTRGEKEYSKSPPTPLLKGDLGGSRLEYKRDLLWA